MSDPIFDGTAAAILKVALANMGYSDAQADARLSAFLNEAGRSSDPEPAPSDEKCAKCIHTYGWHIPGGCSNPGPSCPCTGFLHRYSFPPGAGATGEGETR